MDYIKQNLFNVFHVNLFELKTEQLYIIGTIILLQIILTKLYTNSPFSIHCLIRNISIALSIIYMNPFYFIIAEIILEVIMSLTLNINIDRPINKIINCYEQFDIFRSLKPKELSYYTEGLYKSGQHYKNTTMETAQNQKFKYICEKFKFDKNTRILDLGCGNGGFLEYCRNNYGSNIMGFTISSSQINVLQNKNIPCRLINITEDEFPKDLYGQFDFIFLNGSAEHFYNYDNSLYYYNLEKFDNIWVNIFKKIKNLLDTKSSLKILYFTMIHFRREPNGIKEHIDNYFLERGIPCAYPRDENGIIKNAKDFNVIEKLDKTYDYLQYSLSYSDIALGQQKENIVLYIIYLLHGIPYLLTNPYQLQFWLWQWEASWTNQFRKVQYLLFGTLKIEAPTPPKKQLWIGLKLK